MKSPFSRQLLGVALIVELRAEAFEPFDLLNRYCLDSVLPRGKSGATNIFIGSMRDLNLGDQVLEMDIEFYPGMTEKRLMDIAVAARHRWNLDDVLVIHRVGKIFVGDTIVLVSVWAPHRKESFEACRFILEELKHTAPFWKKEVLSEGGRWVVKNT